MIRVIVIDSWKKRLEDRVGRVKVLSKRTASYSMIYLRRCIAADVTQ